MPVSRIGGIGFRYRAARIETIAREEAFRISGRRRCAPGRAMCPKMHWRRRVMRKHGCGGVSYVSSRRYHDYISVYGKVGIKRVVRMDIQCPSGGRERIRLGQGVLPDHTVGIVDCDIYVDRRFPQEDRASVLQEKGH